MRNVKIIAVSLSMVLVTLFTITNIDTTPKQIEIVYQDLSKEEKQQIDCLAANIYHEAGNEPEQGKQAVALVTLNRTQDERYPSNICEVVKQKRKGTCQFSWFCLKNKSIRDNEAYEKSLEVALFVYANYDKIKDITEGALFYHADYVNPRWRGLTQTTKIGRHIFYKEKVIKL